MSYADIIKDKYAKGVLDGSSFDKTAVLDLTSTVEATSLTDASLYTLGGASIGKSLIVGKGITMSSTTDGFLPPRLTTTQRDALTPSIGMIIYNTTTQKLNIYDGSVWTDYLWESDLTNIKPETIQLFNTKQNYNKCFDGMMCYYDFSDEFKLGDDVSGWNRDAKVYSSEYKPLIDGRSNCIYFNQTSSSTGKISCLDVSQHLADFKDLTNLSMSCWFKTPSTTGTKGLVTFSNGSETGQELGMWITTTNLIGFQLRISDTVIWRMYSPSTVTNNTWYHVAVSCGSLGPQMWINGVQNTVYSVGSAANTQCLAYVSGLTHITIGGNYEVSGYEWAFNGYIGDVSIWGKQLSATEIADLYADNYGYDCVVLAGQSNMIGMAPAEAEDVDYTLISGKVFQLPYDTGVVEAAVNRLLYPDGVNWIGGIGDVGNMGPWKKFIENILSTLPTRRKILLLPQAVGGAGFTGGYDKWYPGADLYNACVTNMNNAIALQDGNTFSAFIWIQGEHEDSQAGANTYGMYINQMYEGLINETALTENVPFLMGEIHNRYATSYLINNNLHKFADDKKRFCIENSDLAVFDGVHFTADSLRTMGERLAVVYKTAISNRLDNDNFVMKDIEYLGEDINIGTNVNINGTLKLGGTAVTSTANELNYLDITTIGTAQASKALVVDATKDITGINNLTITGTLSMTSTTAAFLPPRMTTAQKDALTPSTGMEVYDTTLNTKSIYTGSVWNSVMLSPSSGSYTPTIGDGTNSFTTSVASGYYKTVGGLTFVSVRLVWSGLNSASGFCRVSLPTALTQYCNFTLGASAIPYSTQVVIFAEPGAAYGFIQRMTDNGGSLPNCNTFPINGSLTFSGTYV